LTDEEYPDYFVSDLSDSHRLSIMAGGHRQRDISWRCVAGCLADFKMTGRAG